MAILLMSTRLPSGLPYRRQIGVMQSTCQIARILNTEYYYGKPYTYYDMNVVAWAKYLKLFMTFLSYHPQIPEWDMCDRGSQFLP